MLKHVHAIFGLLNQIKHIASIQLDTCTKNDEKKIIVSNNYHEYFQHFLISFF